MISESPANGGNPAAPSRVASTTRRRLLDAREYPAILSLPLVADRTQEIVPPSDITLCFNAFWRRAVDDAKHPLALLRPGHNDFDWVGGGTKYRTHLRHHAERIENINGISNRKNEHERMSTG